MSNKLLSLATIVALSVFSTRTIAQKVYKEGLVELSVTNPQGTFNGKYYFTADSIALDVNLLQATMREIYSTKMDYDATLLEVPAMHVKRAAVSTPEEIARVEKSYPKLKFAATTDKKVISGFNCRRVAVTYITSGKQFDIWVTNDYTLPLSGLTKFYFDGAGAIPIQYTSFNANGDIFAEILIKSITEQKVPAGSFTVPADFEQVAKDELFSTN